MKIRPIQKPALYAATLMAAAMAPISSWAAPVKLLCDVSNTAVYSDRPAMVEFDEKQGTITVDVSAEHLRNPHGVSGGYDGSGGSGPEKIGPVSAHFSPDSIVFYTEDRRGEKECWNLNRLTGEFRGYSENLCTGEDKDTWAWRMWTCHQAQAKF